MTVRGGPGRQGGGDHRPPAPTARSASRPLPAGPYTVRLPASNFTAPFDGLTWLGPNLVTPAIIGAYIWIWAGFAMVLIAAGLAAMPRDALEAARVDGATEWQVFRRVTIPLVGPVLIVVLVTLIINVLKIFDLVYVSRRSPRRTTPTWWPWRCTGSPSAAASTTALGSALGVLLFLLVLPAMLFNIRRLQERAAMSSATH